VIHLRPDVGIVGAGKVGATLARLWHAAGYNIAAVYSPTSTHAAQLAAIVDAVVVTAPAQVVIASDLTVLSVPDDAIEPVAAVIRVADATGKAIIHNSGAHSVDVLASVAAQGVQVGSLHPAFPFADVDTAVQSLPGATFAIEAGDDPLRSWLFDLVAAVDGQALIIPAGGKAAYHASLVMLSNYTVSLYAAAVRLLAGVAADESAIHNALTTLLAATVENIRTQGLPTALTGPLVRGDAGTIRAHLAAISDADIANAYRELARLTVPLLTARDVDAEFIENLNDLLEDTCD